MSSRIRDDQWDELGPERPSGIPRRGGIGASVGELAWLALGALVFAAIVAAFWLQSYG